MGFNFAIIAQIIIVANLLLLDYFFITNNFTTKDQVKAENPTKSATSAAETAKTTIASSSAGCDSLCQQLINTKIIELKKELGTNNTKTIVQTTVTQTPGEKTIYLGASGSTTLTNWTDIADTSISFNPADYPGAKNFKFVATLRSDAPDRKAFARIYNVTGGLEIWQSEVSYAGLANKTIESLAFSLPQDKLTLKVQIKSFLLNTSYVENPQLKIIY